MSENQRQGAPDPDVQAALLSLPASDPDDDRDAVLRVLRAAMADAHARATADSVDDPEDAEVRQGYLAQQYQSLRPDRWHKQREDDMDHLFRR